MRHRGLSGGVPFALHGGGEGEGDGVLKMLAGILF